MKIQKDIIKKELKLLLTQLIVCYKPSIFRSKFSNQQMYYELTKSLVRIILAFVTSFGLVMAIEVSIIYYVIAIYFMIEFTIVAFLFLKTI